MKTSVERRLEIVNLINKKGKVRVEELAEQFGVSNVTIRSDLNYLEKNGFLIRSHGVALQNSEGISELTIQEKRKHNIVNKTKIGQAAASLINSGDTIILDSGTTTSAIAASIQDVNNVVVMTNGLNIAMELAFSPNIEVLMTGGMLRKNALSFAGSQAENSLKNYRFDKVFLGVDGFDMNAGITTYNEQEASLNRLMCDISAQIIAVADSSKFRRCGCYMIRKVSDIDVLVTDSGIPDDYLTMLRALKIEIIIANKE